MINEHKGAESNVISYPYNFVYRRLLKRTEAAEFCSVGVTHFDGLVACGILPQAKALGQKRLGWDIYELHRAIDELPYASNAQSSGSLDQYSDVA